MRKNLYLLLAFSLMLVSSVSAWAGHLTLEPLAGDNHLIRIAPDADEKYLLLPVEESAPESEVRVVVDNVEQRTLYIRLALTKVDYFVPFLLDEFRGHHLVLYTHVNVDRSNRGGVGSIECLKHISLSNEYDTANFDRFRPAYHHTPTYAWMNDPNGMFYLNGEWHLYYQYGPYGCMWNNMTWGHSVSRDLINWEHRPDAIRPDAHGAIFSGSCIVDHNNTAGFGAGAVIAMYTSAGAVQSQSIAYSLDGGNTFHIYEGNPVLTANIPDFRDPNMFWYEPTQRWILVMSAGQEMRIYSSPNMKDWTYESSFGHGYGCHEGVWECPDLMQLSIEGTNRSKWVLYCNINPGGPFGGSATQYFVGEFDGHTFTCESGKEALWQDYGKDHYATVSFSNAPDGRHTMIAWMSNWQYANNVPTRQFRSANSICREPFLYEAGGHVYLGSRPSPEYDGKGLDEVVKIKSQSKPTVITLTNRQGNEFLITYDPKAMTLSVDRSKSGIVDFSPEFAVVATAPVYRKLTSIRLFIDECSVEVFGNNGEVCLTSLVFPESKLTLK